MSRQTNDPRPPDHTEAARDVARGLSEAASHLAGLKSEAMSWLGDPYSALRLRLESAHAAVEPAMVEARRQVRLNEGNRHR